MFPLCRLLPLCVPSCLFLWRQERLREARQQGSDKCAASASTSLSTYLLLLLFNRAASLRRDTCHINSNTLWVTLMFTRTHRSDKVTGNQILRDVTSLLPATAVSPSSVGGSNVYGLYWGWAPIAVMANVNRGTLNHRREGESERGKSEPDLLDEKWFPIYCCRLKGETEEMRGKKKKWGGPLHERWRKRESHEKWERWMDWNGTWRKRGQGTKWRAPVTEVRSSSV